MSTLDDIKTSLGIKPFTQPTTPAIPSKKIVIVEDDASLAKVLRDAFVGENFTVIQAADGQAGLEAIQKEHPHVVLLDLMMPVMNGRVMLKQLREIPEFKTLPVIVLTNAGEIDNIKQTVNYDDVAEFLIKSNVTLDEIITAVKRAR